MEEAVGARGYSAAIKVSADERMLCLTGLNTPVELSGAVSVIAEYVQWVIFKLTDPYSETTNGVIQLLA